MTTNLAPDPLVLELRQRLASFRRRLWLRRVVRDGVVVLAIVLLAELALAIVARVTPFEFHRLAAVGIALAGLVTLLADAVRVRPTLPETALAVDTENGLHDRVSTALALASRTPELATAPASPPPAENTAEMETEAGRFERLVRLQRRDAVVSLGLADPRAIRLRLPRRPGGVAILAAVLLMPALLLPNAQNEVLAQRQELRDAAEREAQRLEDTAQRLSAGRSETDPRVEVANELRELIRDLRDRPEDLDRQLARLGSLEDALRARIDPANEQRGAAIAALSRSLSRLATGDDGNPTGDVPKTKEDLEQLQDRLGGMTEAERNQLAEDLAELDGLAGQAGTEARAALSDATSALRRGDTQAAADALARLGEVLEGSQNEVEINRDLAATASDLQGARRALAEAGQRGQPGAGGRGQQGQRGEGQAGQGGQGEGGQSGQGQGGQGQGGQGQGGQGQGGQGQGGQGQGGQGQGGQGQGGQGQGGQGQGGNGQGGQGGGSLGGGGSGARHLGSGASQGGFGGPTLGNRQFSTGELDEVFAPVERLGQPGDPSYIAGSGGDGQSQEGHGEGQGTNNESVVPYVEVYQEFRDFAITTLDRSYVPLDVKDYVRDYFTSLDPE